MKYLILGSGGVGSYYGARLVDGGNDVIFVARGEHLKVIKKDGLDITHDEFSFHKKVDARSLENISKSEFTKIDVIILLTKSTSTKYIAKQLKTVLKKKNMPYILSLQNGVENEEILSNYFPKDKIIGGLSRKIGAHVIKPGVIKSTGDVETIIGAISKTKKSEAFAKKVAIELTKCNLKCQNSDDIKLELWKKLIINNGVNAICALLKVKTGVVMKDKKLSKIVYNLMKETAKAGKYKGVNISKDDVKSMFELIKNFNSIKPSMLVDRENGRKLELKEICGVVIKCLKKQNIDAPYTKSISALLEFESNKETL